MGRKKKKKLIPSDIFSVDSARRSGFARRTLDKVFYEDGVDELAHTLRGILPEYPESVLAFINFGIVGLYSLVAAVDAGFEFKDLCHEMEEICHEKHEVKDKLKALAGLCEEKRRYVAQKTGVKFKDSDLTGDLSAASDIVEMGALFVKHQTLKNEEVMLGWRGGDKLLVSLEGLALTSLVPGSALVMASAIEDIRAIEEAGEGKYEMFAEFAEEMAEELEMIAGGFFFAGQALMMAYGGVRAYRGKKKIAEIKEQKHVLGSGFVDIGHADLAQMQQICDFQRKCVQKHSVDYAKRLEVGQALAVAGTACAMTGVGVVAAAPLLAVGMGTTFASSRVRNKWEKKESKFVGKKAMKKDCYKIYTKERDPFAVLTEESQKIRQEMVKKGQEVGIDDVQKGVEDSYQRTADKFLVDFRHATKAMAAQQILLLMRKVFKDKKMSADEKLAFLELKYLKIDFLAQNYSDIPGIKGSDLEGEAIKITKEFYAANKYFIMEGFKDWSNEDFVSCSIGVIDHLHHGLGREMLDLGRLRDNGSVMHDGVSGALNEAQQQSVIKSIGVKPQEKNNDRYIKRVLNKAMDSCKASRYTMMKSVIAVAQCKEQYVKMQSEVGFAVDDAAKMAEGINQEIVTTKEEPALSPFPKKVLTFDKYLHLKDGGLGFEYFYDDVTVEGVNTFIVENVEKNSFAQRAGLLPGDIFEVNANCDWKEALNERNFDNFEFFRGNTKINDIRDRLTQTYNVVDEGRGL